MTGDIGRLTEEEKEGGTNGVVSRPGLPWLHNEFLDAGRPVASSNKFTISTIAILPLYSVDVWSDWTLWTS